MKKLITVLCALSVASAALAVDEVPDSVVPNGVVPNGSMDGWSACTPWTSDGNTSTQGETPKYWTISHVIGINTLGNTLGATSVGSKVEGYNSENAVELKNTANLYRSSQIVPGYITLGTTWSTSKASLFSVSDSDGGTFGGVACSKRPDALTFMYKRTHSTDEVASVIAYLWKGHWTQADVPGNIVMGNSTTPCTMTDRDRNILGIETSQGGVVAKSEDAELIATINTSITGNAPDWTQAEFLFEYNTPSTPSTPAMMNIILCAGNYFSTSPGKDNTLTIDDVRFVYYSRLKDVKIGDTTIPGFSSTTYEYNLDMDLPALREFTPTVMTQSGNNVMEVSRDIENFTYTVVCNNNEGTDFDGESIHTYTFKFKPPFEPEGDYSRYDGQLVIDMEKELGMGVTTSSTSVYILPTTEKACTIALYNMTLEGSSLGDIIVSDVTISQNSEGEKQYNGTADNIVLLGGAITAKAVVTGTEDANGCVSLNINVTWLSENDIIVTFNGPKAMAAYEVNGVVDAAATSDAKALVYNVSAVPDASALTGLANPNALVVNRTGNASSAINTNGNVIVPNAEGYGYSADKINISAENLFHFGYTVSTDNVTFSREIPSTDTYWFVTASLPFTLDPNANSDYEFYKLSGVDLTAKTLDFTQLTNEIEAYTPLLIKIKKGQSITLTGKNVQKQDPDLQIVVDKNGITFYKKPLDMPGWYAISANSKTADGSSISVEDKPWNGHDVYAISNDKFNCYKKGFKINPFRTYFIYSSADAGAPASTSVPQFSITINGEDMSGIEEIDSDNATDANLYDLQGRPVDNNYRGIVIGSGKKTFQTK